MSYSTGAELYKCKRTCRKSLEEALLKIYTAKPCISLPKVLWGKRFMMVLIDEKEVENGNRYISKLGQKNRRR